MKRSVPYALIETFLHGLGVDDPQYVRSVLVRAPRTIEVTTYARDADGDKHIGDGGGVALEAQTIHIETDYDPPELREGLRNAEQLEALYRERYGLHAVDDES